MSIMNRSVNGCVWFGGAKVVRSSVSVSRVSSTDLDVDATGARRGIPRWLGGQMTSSRSTLHTFSKSTRSA
jgi:hypothetical protein